MSDYQIIWPDDFDKVAWLIESKGWLQGIEVRLGEQSTELTFYDKVRLAQDIEDDLSSQGYFLERNVVVIDRVTKEAIEKVVARLVNTRALWN